MNLMNDEYDRLCSYARRTQDAEAEAVLLRVTLAEVRQYREETQKELDTAHAESTHLCHLVNAGQDEPTEAAVLRVLRERNEASEALRMAKEEIIGYGRIMSEASEKIDELQEYIDKHNAQVLKNSQAAAFLGLT